MGPHPSLMRRTWRGRGRQRGDEEQDGGQNARPCIFNPRCVRKAEGTGYASQGESEPALKA